jgi:DNA-binding transcriptional LysR family regulator
LFYYVVRHRGISAAVRHIPYGIQQPAVSGQIKQLEQDLGVTLFARQPFCLTPAGESLYEFAEPFFSKAAGVAARIRKSAGVQVCVGGSELMLREHLPQVIQQVKKTWPELGLAMRNGFQPQLEPMLLTGEVDLAIVTASHARRPAGLQRQVLVRVPLVLQVPRDSPVKTAGTLWKGGRPLPPLVSCVPTPDWVFQRELKRRGIEWRPAIEANSLEQVGWYVANGHGIGVSIALPEFQSKAFRTLPLDDFDPVEIIALYRDTGNPVVERILSECVRYAAERWPRFAVAPAANR